MDKRGWLGSKRAMSPLIATVLLIAFAVAMGAMIMNWTTDLNPYPDCANVKLVESQLCFTQNMLKLGLQNLGDAVDGLAVVIADSSQDSSVDLRDSSLEPSASLARDLPFTKSGKTSVAVYSLVEFNGKPTRCDKPSIYVEDVPTC